MIWRMSELQNSSLRQSDTGPCQLHVVDGGADCRGEDLLGALRVKDFILLELVTKSPLQ